MAPTAREDKKSSAKRVAVVGAGVSGLAAAYKLKSHGLNVMVFEAEGRAGGKLRSISQGGLIWDEGANTMTESEMEVRNLLDDLGIREKQQLPISQNKRYIVRNGEPVLIPSDPIALIKSNILSTQSKLQLILEPFLWKKSDSAVVSDANANESVGEFFQRHFGKEVVDFLIDPFVAGTSAGDPDTLVMRHSFPELWNLEKRFGSVIAGAIQSKLFAKRDKGVERKGSSERRRHQRGSFSFVGGMQTLTDSLCKKLDEDELKLKSKVLSLSYGPEGISALENWSLCYSSNHAKHSQALSFDAVIMTAPVCNVKEMKIKKGGNLFPLNFLPEVSYMPLSVIITTFRKENVKKPLEGFGVLVPSKEQQNGLKTLGTLFSSMMFPDRAPKNLYLYTTFVGGSRNRELAKASTDELKQIVTSDLKQLLGVEGEPTFLNHFFWSKAFPLYGRNYDSVLEAIEKMEKNLPGFFYAGNHRGGLSVGKSIASGCKAADLVISYLENSSDN
ncbi:protoporphyrinogen oxidase, mitochondrial isoform X1 [Mangifera indica]|uniref:protoporphyrinogen oxidase, mitochondrial isoform X1 n=2 Tax=Mangifera indica TaxID=29780 RepID=UPI001CFB47B4|nr:protoporphyrinogen oxidase, mitochondrial isoform X1 [Mangifera indica]